MHVAYANQAQESFLDGRNVAFERLGGVPSKMIRYDNLTPAVISARFQAIPAVWLFHEGIFDPVGLTTELQEPAVVDQTVDDGGGHVVVTEHCSPAGELQISGDDQAAFFVPVSDDLEQEPSPFGVDREVAQLVDLCGCPHSLTYAEPATMPRLPPARAGVWGPCGLRLGIVTGSRGTRGSCLLGGIGQGSRMPAWSERGLSP